MGKRQSGRESSPPSQDPSRVDLVLLLVLIQSPVSTSLDRRLQDARGRSPPKDIAGLYSHHQSAQAFSCPGSRARPFLSFPSLWRHRMRGSCSTRALGWDSSHHRKGEHRPDLVTSVTPGQVLSSPLSTASASMDNEWMGHGQQGTTNGSLWVAIVQLNCLEKKVVNCCHHGKNYQGHHGQSNDWPCEIGPGRCRSISAVWAWRASTSRGVVQSWDTLAAPRFVVGMFWTRCLSLSAISPTTIQTPLQESPRGRNGSHNGPTFAHQKRLDGCLAATSVTPNAEECRCKDNR